MTSRWAYWSLAAAGLGALTVAGILNRPLPKRALAEHGVHDHQDRIHDDRHQRGPLQQEPGHDQDEADVLRMSHTCVGPRRREPVRALRLVKHFPRGGEQPETGTDEDVARNMERPEVRIGLPAEQHLQQVPGVM